LGGISVYISVFRRRTLLLQRHVPLLVGIGLATPAFLLRAGGWLSRPSKARLLGLIVGWLPPVLIVSGFLGARFRLAGLLIALLAAYHLGYRRVRLSILFLSAVLLAWLFVVAGVERNYVGSRQSAPTINRSNFYDRYLVSHDLGEFREFVITIEGVPKAVDFQHGRTFLSIIPGIPVRTGGQLYSSTFFGAQYASGTSISPSLLGELYMNFGLGGILGGMAVFGLLIGLVEAWFRRNRHFVGTVLVYSFSLLPVALELRGDFTSMTSFYLAGVVPLMIGARWIQSGVGTGATGGPGEDRRWVPSTLGARIPEEGPDHSQRPGEVAPGYPEDLSGRAARIRGEENDGRQEHDGVRDGGSQAGSSGPERWGEWEVEDRARHHRRPSDQGRFAWSVALDDEVFRDDRGGGETDHARQQQENAAHGSPIAGSEDQGEAHRGEDGQGDRGESQQEEGPPAELGNELGAVVSVGRTDRPGQSPQEHHWDLDQQLAHVHRDGVLAEHRSRGEEPNEELVEPEVQEPSQEGRVGPDPEAPQFEHVSWLQLWPAVHQREGHPQRGEAGERDPDGPARDHCDQRTAAHQEHQGQGQGRAPRLGGVARDVPPGPTQGD
jgi:hypothetical protein